MKDIENQPKFDKSQEEKLREKGFQIERAQLLEGEPRQCEKCMSKDNDFQFHQTGWFIEGEFYCPKHKEGVIKVLEKINKEAERTKLEQERIIKERGKQSGLK